LVDAEFLYQQGLPPQATYTFKHALIHDVAYQSLLRSTRQQYHQRIAQVGKELARVGAGHARPRG
jgi:predicted ATPase